ARRRPPLADLRSGDRWHHTRLQFEHTTGGDRARPLHAHPSRRCERAGGQVATELRLRPIRRQRHVQCPIRPELADTEVLRDLHTVASTERRRANVETLSGLEVQRIRTEDVTRRGTERKLWGVYSARLDPSTIHLTNSDHARIDRPNDPRLGSDASRLDVAGRDRAVLDEGGTRPDPQRWGEDQ